jgi:penicillin amidase
MLLVLMGLASLAAGCGDDDMVMDGGLDAGDGDGGMGDGGPPTTIEEIPAEAELQIPGLTGTVSAVQDDRGMWHIYAEDLGDAFRAEGYLMARDRWGQMDLIRRQATGRLAQAAGALDDGLVEDDIDTRFAGWPRTAQALLDTLPAEEVELLQAFSDGVNVYVDEIRDGTRTLPRGTAQTWALFGNRMDYWAPIDTLSIARFQSAELSYDPGDDIGTSEFLAAFRAAFPASSTDPRIAARATTFHDFYRFEPSRNVYTRDDFPNEPTDTGSRAIRPPRRGALREAPLPSLGQLSAAKRFADRIEDRFQRVFGDETRGSNSWVVHGDHTASGNPILANDPHLQLTSPPLFWMVHIDTKRAGGDVNVAGLALTGTPSVLLGYNDRLAWGLTTHGFDVTDVYLETITAGASGMPDTVEYQGTQIPIQTVTETIEINDGSTMDVTFEYVETPDGVGGPRWIIPDTREATSAMSIKWTGYEPTNELRAFLMLARAATVDDARDAYDNFAVGGQNLVVVTSEGDIWWSTNCNLPVRDARAMTYDPATGLGVAPFMVMPGTGEHEWLSFLDDRYLPHDQNPSRGFIVTANNAGVDVTSDGNPFDAPHYIGWNFNDGHRMARITERVQEVVTRGDVTPMDMSDVQNDAESPYGRLMRDALVAELDRAAQEAATPGTHADLSDAVTEAGAAKMAKIAMMRDRLMAWTFDTPAAVENTPSADEIADSVATTIFNAALGRLMSLALADEFTAIGVTRGFRGRTILAMLNEPDTMASYDASLRGGMGDSIFWDDLATDGVTESRGDRVLRAFVAALDWLEGPAPDGAALGTDMNEWRWGKLHRLWLKSIVPQVPITNDVIGIPAFADPVFGMGRGFPRHGDNEVVDAAAYGLGDTTDFTYGSGPQQRLVVEMTASGPVAVNALPGGESIDPDDPHHADEIELWRMNQVAPVYYTESDVLLHHERRWSFAP